MDHCPYAEFWFDGNYGCALGGECEGLPCDIAADFEDDPDDLVWEDEEI
jgi:hypothetical protein